MKITIDQSSYNNLDFQIHSLGSDEVWITAKNNKGNIVFNIIINEKQANTINYKLREFFINKIKDE